MANRGYYEHSGEFTLSGVAVSLAIGAAVGSVLAAVYAYLALYIPLAGVITFILAIGFGALAGMGSGFGLVLGRVRNRSVAGIVATVVALASLYASWAVWCFAMLRRAEVEDVSLLAILLSPQGLWALIDGLNQVGAWSLTSFTPTGGTLWAIWAVEALLVVAPAVLLAVAAVSSPFCERCDAWTTETSGAALLGLGDPRTLISWLEAKDFASLERMGSVASDATGWYRFDLHHCESCGDFHTLTVKQVTLKVDDKGNISESTEDLVEQLLLSRAEADSVRGLEQRVGQASAAA